MKVIVTKKTKKKTPNKVDKIKLKKIIDKISEELQEAGFTEASKWLDCKYEL